MKMKMVARLLGSIAAGCLLAAPGLALGQGQTQQRTIDLNFNNVELKLVVRALGELTGRNFVTTFRSTPAAPVFRSITFCGYRFAVSRKILLMSARNWT